MEFQPIRTFATVLQLYVPNPFASFDASHVDHIDESLEKIDKRQLMKYRRYSNFKEGNYWEKYVKCNEEIETSVIPISRIYMTRLQNHHDGCVQVLQTLNTNDKHESQFTRIFFINYFLEKRREKNGLFICTNIVIYNFQNQTKDVWTIKLCKTRNLFRKQYMNTVGRKVFKYTDGKSWIREFFKRSNHILLKPCRAGDKKERAPPVMKVFMKCSTRSVQQKINKVTTVSEEGVENTKEMLRTDWALSCSQKVTSPGTHIKCLCKYMCSHHKKECHEKDNKDDYFQSIIELGPIPGQSISVLAVTMRVNENELVEEPDGGILEQSVPNLPGQLGLFGVEPRPELYDDNENVEAQVITEHDIISIHENNSILSSTALSLSNCVRRLTNPAVLSSTSGEINQETEPTQNQNTVRKEIQNSNCQPVPCTGAHANIQQSEQAANSSCHYARNAQNPSVSSANSSCNSVRNTPSPLLGAVGGFDNEHPLFEESNISRENSTMHGRFHEESRGRSTILHSVRGRAQTFNTGWIRISPTPDRLAKAGFYYCGPNDRTRCICCGIHLEDWNPDDNPLAEHLRYSPNCRFANNSDLYFTDSSVDEED